MKTKNIIVYIIICLIIIAGIAVWDSKGFRAEMQYSSRKQIELSNHTGIEVNEVEQIVKDVLGDVKFFVQPVEKFGNAVSIVATNINEEQRNQIVEKFNEKYSYDLDANDVEIKTIPFTRVKDVVKNFIVPGVITLGIILVYFVIRYRKIGVKQVLIKTILSPIIAELLIFSLMAIVRISFGRLAIALGVGLYVVVIAILTNIFENERIKYFEELQKEQEQVKNT